MKEIKHSDEFKYLYEMVNQLGDNVDEMYTAIEEFEKRFGGVKYIEGKEESCVKVEKDKSFFDLMKDWLDAFFEYHDSAESVNEIMQWIYKQLMTNADD